jgi:uncharacterized repeat protein (TIGR01451 family)
VGTITISATEGTTFSSTAIATFTESNTSFPASNFTATINWGDGTSSTGSAVTVTGTGNGTLTVAGSHVYADELATGAATVVLTQTTPSTATGTATGTASAAEAETLTAGTPVTATATQGSTFSGTVATFTTSFTGNVASDFTATINWGDGSTSTVSGSSITATGGTLTVKGSHVYTATGTETATVVLSDDAPGTATGTASAAITVASTVTPTPTLTIAKTGSPATIAVGGSETYTVTISNTGGAAATSTAFSDVLPTGLTFVSATDSLGGTVTNTNGTLSETIGSLAAAATDTVTIIVTVGSSLAGTSVTNTAGVSASNFNNGAAITSSFAVSVNTTVPPSVGLLAGTAGDGTPQTFVHNLYRELLGREPDSAGQAYWLSILGSNASNAAVRANVIRGFLYSAEFETHFVTSLYQDFLGRAPDAAGLHFYVGILSQKHDLVEVIKFIAGSQEYFTHAGGTASGFMTALYRDLLGRATDATSAFWVNQIGNEGLNNVVSGLLLAPEGANKFFNGNFETLVGNAAVASAGAVQTGNYALANLTGNGWANLFFQGNPPASLVSTAVSQLEHNAGKNAIQAIIGLMSSSQFYG